MGEWKRLGCAHANLGVVANPNPKVLSWHGIQRLVQVRIFTIPFSSLRIILQYEMSSCEGFSSFKITLVVKEHPQWNITPPKFDTQPESHGREDSIRNHCFQVRAVNFGSVPDQLPAFASQIWKCLSWIRQQITSMSTRTSVTPTYFAC